MARKTSAHAPCLQALEEMRAQYEAELEAQADANDELIDMSREIFRGLRDLLEAGRHHDALLRIQKLAGAGAGRMRYLN